MNYTLNQLQIFLKIVQTQSVTKAAAELHLTQPAVSIQLKNFQDQFSIPLTELIGRRLYITEFGHEIAQSAENILDQVYAINYKTLAYEGKLSGKLKLSVASTGKYVMPYFLSDFMKLHGGIELQMDVTNKSRVIESLEHNEVDFALVSVLPDKLQLESLELIPNKLFLAGKAGTAAGSEATAEDIFSNYPLIFREKGSATRQALENYLEKNTITASKKMELTSNEAVKQAMLADLGISIVPLIGMHNELNNKELQIIPMEGLPIVSSWRLIWLKGKKHAPVPKAYIDFLQLEKQKIIERNFNWYSNF